MRHPTRAEIDKFNEILGLIEDPKSQDWEIECSDPERIDEYIECYGKHAHTEEEKFTLMALILGAFDEYHALNLPATSAWWKVKKLLLNDLTIHRDHIEYYQCGNEVDDVYMFPITSKMREIKL